MRALVVLASLALVACGSSEESTTIGGTTFTQNESEGSATITNERGSLTALEGAAAEKTEFPDYAPRYPGAAVESAIVSTSERGERTTAVLNTDDTIAQVADFYRARFAAAGLEMGMDMSTDETAMLSAQGDGKKATVTVAQQDGKTTFTVAFSGA